MESGRAALGNVCALRLFACPSAGGWASATSIECLGTRDVKHGILHEVLHNEELTPPQSLLYDMWIYYKKSKNLDYKISFFKLSIL